MEHKFPLGSFHWENGTTFSESPFILENLNPVKQTKSRVPFTSQPEFPNLLVNGKRPGKLDLICSQVIMMVKLYNTVLYNTVSWKGRPSKALHWKSQNAWLSQIEGNLRRWLLKFKIDLYILACVADETKPWVTCGGRNKFLVADSQMDYTGV